MQWIPDPTGRFPMRPHFEVEVLDQRAEQCAEDFLRRRRGLIAYPLLSNDLVALVEERVSDLDLFADLSPEGDDVEGVTYFVPGGRPRVLISEALDDPRRENRQRMTLAHELGHVELHNDLWPADRPPELFPAPTEQPPVRCLRRAIARPGSGIDWMEWQASYFASALLVPRRKCQSLLATAPAGSDPISTVAEAFQVSRDAARVRLAYITA